MLFSNVVAAIATVAAIAAPTIPGCGTISSGLLKIGMILTASSAAKIAEKASTGQPVKETVAIAVTDACIIGVCTYAAVIGLISGGVAAALAIIFTVTIEAAIVTTSDEYTEFKEITV